MPGNFQPVPLLGSIRHHHYLARAQTTILQVRHPPPRQPGVSTSGVTSHAGATWISTSFSGGVRRTTQRAGHGERISQTFARLAGRSPLTATTSRMLRRFALKNRRSGFRSVPAASYSCGPAAALRHLKGEPQVLYEVFGERLLSLTSASSAGSPGVARVDRLDIARGRRTLASG